MGVSISTLKWMAPAAWLIDFAAQQYGFQSSPNMLDRHNQNMSFLSPYAWFIPAFFTPQQVVQVWWLYRLWKLDPKVPSQRAELDIQADYVPYYTIGNLCIAVWMLFWNSNNMKGSNVFVWINSLSQLAYLTGIVGNLGKLNTRSTSSWLTHINAKTFAGIGVLDLLHNTGTAYFVGQQPGALAKAMVGVGFGLASASSDWIFGGCMVYDLIALAVGQSSYNPDWAKLLGAYAVGSAAIVAGKNLAR